MSTDAAPSFANPEISGCPWSTYRQLQDERPVYRDPVTGFYEVTRWEDIRKVASDPDTFGSKMDTRIQSGVQGEIRQLYETEGFPMVPTMINNDPPDHRTIRSLVDKAFTAIRIRKLEPNIEALANDLIDGFASRGSAEFVNEFAIPLPMVIIAEQLGVPRSRQDEFKSWSDALLGVNDPLTPQDQLIPLTRKIIDMQQFLATQVERMWREPDDTIIGTVSQATVDGRRLELGELVNIFQNVLVAGNETTTQAFGNSMQLLVSQPGLQDRLRANPNETVTFVEESLRLFAPLQGFFRKTRKDVELGGTLIPAESMVILRFGAGGRDPRRFECPEQVQLDRKNAREHLTFGYGIHFCIGNQLARAELRIGLVCLLERLRNIRLAPGPDAVFYKPSFLTYGPRHMQIQFDPG
ncbi:MAG: cytochrome P450 [Steroidobacteraceae bacterium]